MSEIEEWRQIPEYPRYEVSSFGNIRTKELPRLKQYVNGRGYLSTCLTSSGSKRTIRVHTFVAAAFVGPRPEGLQINHKDGNKFNNRASNLEYVTASQNIRHAIALGLSAPAGHGSPKLSEGQVLEIRRRAPAERANDLAAEFGDFFAKSVDALKPGGVLALVTSHYTLDKQNAAIRLLPLGSRPLASATSIITRLSGPCGRQPDKLNQPDRSARRHRKTWNGNRPHATTTAAEIPRTYGATAPGTRSP